MGQHWNVANSDICLTPMLSPTKMTYVFLVFSSFPFFYFDLTYFCFSSICLFWYFCLFMSVARINIFLKMSTNILIRNTFFHKSPKILLRTLLYLPIFVRSIVSEFAGHSCINQWIYWLMHGRPTKRPSSCYCAT